MTIMTSDSSTHSHLVLRHFKSFFEHAGNKKAEVTVDGRSLDIASVVATTRYDATLQLSESSVHAVSESARVLQEDISGGRVIYGVNTGFGGSADIRTQKIDELQDVLVRELRAGILNTPPQYEPNEPSESKINGFDVSNRSSHIEISHDSSNDRTCMPETWVKAAMLVRTNSLASGYSGVRPVLIENLIKFLQHDVLPRVPLRGSISASGDLMPLSYIGGLLQGKANLFAMIGDKSLGQRRTVNAAEALKSIHLEPVRLAPKEGLAIINGTSVSTGLATLVTHDANGLAVLAQILTAMSVEALCGTAESFDPLFAHVRPHPGQIESSSNIRSFLQDSKLVNFDRGLEAGSLRQDRYSLRTASQWIGPVLEDLQLAFQQVTIECNSVTDNPLVDVSNARMLHGGNFQAMAITSAMEKTKLSLQIIGQMLYAQCTEMINPKTNYGLPPNLVADDPSASFLMKSVDIMIAALQSELGFLANPVSTHVQSAEMGNQALNSLALISARYCHEAVDVLSQLVAAHLFAVCQALDLRAMHIRYLETLEPAFKDLVTEHLTPIVIDHDNNNSNHTNTTTNGHSSNVEKTAHNSDSNTTALTNLHSRLWSTFQKLLDQTTTLDPPHRFPYIVQSLQPIILSTVSPHKNPSNNNILSCLFSWTEKCTSLTLETFQRNRDEYSRNPDATAVIGVASRRIYTYIRHDLGVPFIRFTAPPPSSLTPETSHVEEGDGDVAGVSTTVPEDKSVGSYITQIYNSIRSGEIFKVAVLGCLGDAIGPVAENGKEGCGNGVGGKEVEEMKVELEKVDFEQDGSAVL